ncbi:hypothetical protein FVE85_8751 [Porphyridium purpureum]|uniref:Uncharacterized protein n=1 Tax=Porphyridium purpureum TaxID=35688 RepID=A0A5J4YPP8_PORPP|nr:hypothetical protein FVE85_8751 [Porphyridium purpureum]|eukprot:POR9325..scf296_7
MDNLLHPKFTPISRNMLDAGKQTTQSSRSTPLQSHPILNSRCALRLPHIRRRLLPSSHNRRHSPPPAQTPSVQAAHAKTPVTRSLACSHATCRAAEQAMSMPEAEIRAYLNCLQAMSAAFSASVSLRTSLALFVASVFLVVLHSSGVVVGLGQRGEQLGNDSEVLRLSIDQLHALLQEKNQSVAIGAGTRLSAMAMEGLVPLNQYRMGYVKEWQPSKGWGMQYCGTHNTPRLEERNINVCDIGEPEWTQVIVFGDSMLNAHYPSFAELSVRYKLRFRMLDQSGCIETFLDDAPRTYTPACLEGRKMVKQQIDKALVGSWVLLHAHTALACVIPRDSGLSCEFGNGNRVRLYFPEMEYIQQRGLNVAFMGDAMFMYERCPSVESQGGTKDCVGPNKAEKSTAALAEYVMSQKLADVYIDLLECFRVETDDPSQPPNYIYRMYGGSVSLMNDDHHLSYNGGMMSLPCKARGIERMLALQQSA